jgi:hypothetical protein
MFHANLAQLDSYRVWIETKIKETARQAKISNLLLQKSIPHKEPTINFVHNERKHMLHCSSRTEISSIQASFLTSSDAAVI